MFSNDAVKIAVLETHALQGWFYFQARTDEQTIL